LAIVALRTARAFNIVSSYSIFLDHVFFLFSRRHHQEQIKIAEHLDEDPDQLKQLHRIYAGLSKHAEKINEEVNTFISSCSD